MSGEKKKPEHPSQKDNACTPFHFNEQHIVVEVLEGTTQQQVEQQIHDALSEQPADILTRYRSKELVIILQHEGNGPPPPELKPKKPRP